MANATFTEVQARIKNLKIISGRISITGATVPANAVVTLLQGLGIASVARTAAGTYTIKLSENYPILVSATFLLQAAVPIDLVPQMLSFDVVGNRTVVVGLLAGATPTDSLNDVVHIINFGLHLRNSSVAR